MNRKLLSSTIASLTAVSMLAACGGSKDTSSSSASNQLATACYANWGSTTAYNGGSTVSYAGVNYTAAFRTQNQNPSIDNGPSGSGQPWVSNGACGTTPTPTVKRAPKPTPSPTHHT